MLKYKNKERQRGKQSDIQILSLKYTDFMIRTVVLNEGTNYLKIRTRYTTKISVVFIV